MKVSERASNHLMKLSFPVVPDWLQVYFHANSEHDHVLKWDLFTLEQMEYYDGLMAIYLKSELHRLVKRY